MSMKRYEKICEVCGQPFIAKNTLAKYCSEKCGSKVWHKAWYERKKNKAEKPEVKKPKVAKPKVKKPKVKKVHTRPHLLKPLIERYPKVCVVCGKEFKALLPHAKYCSPECVQQAHHEQANKDKVTYNRVCPVCGKRFNTTDADKIYCTVECRGFGQYLKVKPDKEKRKSQLDENARRADECGLSYGKYMAALRLGKTYEELYALHVAELNRMEEF